MCNFNGQKCANFNRHRHDTDEREAKLAPVSVDEPDIKIAATNYRTLVAARRWFSPRSAGRQQWVEAGVGFNSFECDLLIESRDESAYLDGGDYDEACASWQPQEGSAPALTPVSDAVSFVIGMGLDGRRFGDLLQFEPMKQSIAKRKTDIIRARPLTVGIQYHIWRR